MERETFERALHLWPDWHESIEGSREKLGYDPGWPIERAVKWVEENYAERVQPQAVTELERLALPPNLFEYWEDCFYCDYRRPDGGIDFDRIRRRIAFEERDKLGNKTGRWLPGNRSLPPLPYELSVVNYPDEDIQSPWVRLELMVHSSFVGRDMLDEASVSALRLLRHLRATGRFKGRRHAVSGYVSKAKANISERKRSGVERYNRGEIDFEGLMEEEWLRPDTKFEVSQNIAGRSRFWSADKALRWEQDKIYNRVRRWFPDPKPKVAEKNLWRQRLSLPPKADAT